MQPTRFGRPLTGPGDRLLALFVALGGVGYAAATGSIDGREIRNNAVATKDLKNNDVRGKDIRASTIAGSDVAPNTLTGSDIDETSLGKVGSASTADGATNATNAANAGNANTVGGLRLVPFVYRTDSTSAITSLASVGGLEVRADCSAGDNDLLLTNRSGRSPRLALGGVDVADLDTGADADEGKTANALANNNDLNAASIVPDDQAIGQASFVTSANRSVASCTRCSKV